MEVDGVNEFSVFARKTDGAPEQHQQQQKDVGYSRHASSRL
jgi:hypothetical protein